MQMLNINVEDINITCNKLDTFIDDAEHYSLRIHEIRDYTNDLYDKFNKFVGRNLIFGDIQGNITGVDAGRNSIWLYLTLHKEKNAVNVEITYPIINGVETRLSKINKLILNENRFSVTLEEVIEMEQTKNRILEQNILDITGYDFNNYKVESVKDVDYWVTKSLEIVLSKI